MPFRRHVTAVLLCIPGYLWGGTSMDMAEGDGSSLSSKLTEGMPVFVHPTTNNLFS